jgi:phosphoglucomutase
MMHQRYLQWVENPQLTNQEREILKGYSQAQINDAFFKDIEFGTAGMRGILGPGTNRINRFTVQKAMVAFGQYLIKQFPNLLAKGVVIAHDNRHEAEQLTALTAKVLNQMGIPTWTFKELVPTPLLSYAVRYQGAIGGVMLTASHNPKEYNGVKIYDEQGCQLVPYKINQVIEFLSRLPDFLAVTIPSVHQDAVNQIISDDVAETYLKKVEQLQLQPTLNKTNFPIIFSPQHGTSYRILPMFMRRLGYDLILVEKQAIPDPDFSFTASPNPEDPSAYLEAIALAKTMNAPLVMIADPDADRVGIGYRNAQGVYILLNGNLSAALLLDYILSQKKHRQQLPPQGVIYDTIVSSPLARQVARAYGVKVETFLTGFKFIGDRIHFYQTHAGPQFLFGYEESYGCLIGDFVRDKDGIQALTLYAEMTLHHWLQGRTLGDALNQLFQKYGFYLDRQYAIQLEGEKGQAQLQTLMNTLRKTPFKSLADHKIKQVDDYLNQVSKDNQGHLQTIALPQSDVMQFHLEDGSQIIVRPSGTEPKCKFYYMIRGQNLAECEAKLATIKQAFETTYLL